MPRKKKEKIERSNDEIREIILKFFYDAHKNASTAKKMRLKISEVKSELRKSGLDSKEIIRNLDYLMQTGFIVKEEETIQIRTNKGIFPSKKIYYKASDKTINYFEGVSKFQKLDKSLSGINVNNVQGVTTIVVGDSNMVVNSQYIELYKSLDLLAASIQKSDSLSDEEKLNYIGEIETIKSQLIKPTPNKDIIKQAWEKLKTLATVSGVVTFFKQVAKLLGWLL
jgi:hypothetical protein